MTFDTCQEYGRNMDRLQGIFRQVPPLADSHRENMRQQRAIAQN